jgi:DNA-directed RNA polymerase alpha subunit
LHRVVAVRVLVTLRAVVAGVRELAMRLRVKVRELVVPLVRVRAAAEAVALVEVDAVYVCFRAHTRSV